MSESQLKWLEIKDFSPGIRQRLNLGLTVPTSSTVSVLPVGETTQVNGAAAVDGTFRCIALASGGLGPLPKRSTGFTRNSPGITGTAVISCFEMMGPTVAYTSGAAPSGIADIDYDKLRYNNSFIVGYAYDTGGDRKVIVERWPPGISTTRYDNLITFTDTGAAGKTFGGIFAAYSRSAFGGDPTQTGPPIVVVSYVSKNTTTATTPFGFTIGWPDPHSPQSTAALSDSVPGGWPAGHVVGHQNRIVFLIRRVWAQGATDIGTFTTQDVIYSEPNNYHYGVNTFGAFAPEEPVGIGAAASLNASDMLLICHQFGAYLVQGDIGNPVVRRLPGVTPTAGVEVIGALTRLGYVYGSNNGGVYAWGGGDGSNLLSPQLDGDFWQIGSIPNDSLGSFVHRFGGKFSTFREWILVPNNWVFDGNAWWRLEDPSVMQFWMYQPDVMQPWFYACKPTMSNSDNTPIYQFDGTAGATNWSWQSQAIIVGNFREVDIKELIVVFQSLSTSGGTLTITLTDQGGNNVTETINYTHQGGRVQVVRREAYLQSDAYFRAKVVFDGGSNSAGILNSLRFGFEEVTELPRT